MNARKQFAETILCVITVWGVSSVSAMPAIHHQMVPIVLVRCFLLTALMYLLRLHKNYLTAIVFYISSIYLARYFTHSFNFSEYFSVDFCADCKKN